MTARYLIGDVLEVLPTLEAGSVDLIMTSPPFLALRSYLPSDHPLKAKEGGSQPTPGAFIDWLVDVVEALDRVLAPHGSMVLELGDTFSGSGGAGGDYAENGWRDGQPTFGGSATASRESAWSIPQAHWFAGVIDTEGWIGVRRQEADRDSPSFSAAVRITMMDRQVCDRAAEISGVGSVTQDGRGAYSWSVVGQQARYVLTNIWPYLLIKQRQAMAGIELQRHISEKKRRGKYERIEPADIEYRQMIRDYVGGLNGRGENRGVYVPTWEPPTPPMLHPPVTGPLDGWPASKSLALIPELLRFTLVYGFNPLTGRQTKRWRLRNVVRWVRPNPPVGALGDKFRPATSELMVFCRTDEAGRKRYFDLDSVRGEFPEAPHGGWPISDKYIEAGLDSGSRLTRVHPAGAPPLDWWNIPLLDGEESIPCETCQQPSWIVLGCPSCSGSRRQGATPKRDRSKERWAGQVPHDKATGRDGGTGAQNPNGAPPLDWWEIPPGGYQGAHYAVFPEALCVRPIKAMCPERVCRTCGEPSRRITAVSYEPHGPRRDEPKAVRGARHGVAEDHALGASGEHAQSMINGRATKNVNTLGWSDCSHPCQTCGGSGEGHKSRFYETTGRSTDNVVVKCPACNGSGLSDNYRPGLILDPFAGSGTTLAVAVGHGRDAIGIDLDVRNLELARGRLGMFLEEAYR